MPAVQHFSIALLRVTHSPSFYRQFSSAVSHHSSAPQSPPAAGRANPSNSYRRTAPSPTFFPSFSSVQASASGLWSKMASDADSTEAATRAFSSASNSPSAPSFLVSGAASMAVSKVFHHSHHDGCGCVPPLKLNGDAVISAPSLTHSPLRLISFQSPQYIRDAEVVDLLKRNRVWVDSKGSEYFADTSKRMPKTLWIGCSDARVPANEIIGKDGGELFVHRNIGNLVANNDMNCASVVQYAVEYLGVENLVVCGHYDCGAVRASMRNRDHGMLEMWLRNVRDVYRLHLHELDAIEDPEERHHRLVELNVVEQCLNLHKMAVIQQFRVKSYMEQKRKQAAEQEKERASKEANLIQRNEESSSPNGGSGAVSTKSEECVMPTESGSPPVINVTPKIFALVYNPKTGLLQDLPVRFKEVISKMNHVYDLVRPERDSIDCNAAVSQTATDKAK